MATTEALPSAEDQQLDEQKATHTELIRLEADFAEGGEFGRRTLSVTQESVSVLEASGARAFQMPMSEIQTARNEPLVGGGRLEITGKNGDILPIITYSQTVAAGSAKRRAGLSNWRKVSRSRSI